MKEIILGKTGIKTLCLGFGGIPLQRCKQEQACALIGYCLKKGVTFFDSARAYTTSESLIGGAVKNCRKTVFLATKSPALSFEETIGQVNTSLDAFGTDCIDLYQAHNVKSPEHIDAIFSRNGAYGAFLKLRDAGKVFHFGITSHKKEVLDYALDNYADKTETIMFPYNIVENQGEKLFRKAKSLNVGTIAMKPLAGGNLTDAPLALRYALDNDFIDLVLPGIGSPTEAEENLSVNFAPLSKAERERCAAVAKDLGRNFCRRCGYCQPCPQGIDIAGVFSMQVYANKYNLRQWAAVRYNAMPKHAADCIRCGLCRTRCPYNINIPARLREAHSDLLDP